MRKFILLALSLVILMASVNAQDPTPSSEEVMNTAFKKANDSGKKVFLMFHASWCGWCHKMDTAMADPAVKKYFDDNFVITHLTILESEKNKHLENSGGKELYDRLAPQNSGIPFWVIYDGNGKILADAKMPDGNNTGCPATEPEVNNFIEVLKKTTNLNAAALASIHERFRENDPKYKKQ